MQQVDRPAHYDGDLCIRTLARVLTPDELFGFVLGNIIKYEWRADRKGGQTDLQKAQWYKSWYVKYVSQEYDASHAAYIRGRIDTAVEQALRLRDTADAS